MTIPRSVINPGPVDEIRQDNAHRVGAPNHLHTSGENPMVETELAHDAAMYAAVRTRLAGQTYRFLTAGRGGLTVHVDELAVLVAEIVAEYTDHLTAERDALAEDLAWELNATRTGTERGAA